MDLHQLHVSYQPDEDRLLYRASFKTEDGSLQEVRAWLTRRMVRGLWTGIVNTLQAQVTMDKPQAAHAKADIVGMEHHASVEGSRDAGNFNNPFEESSGQTYPLGETPILPTTINFALNPGGPIRINLAPAQGGGFEVAFSPTVLHGFCVLLRDAVAKADWDMELTIPGTSGSGAEHRVLN